MPDSQNRSYADYSPDISIELHLHGERFAVAAIGPDTVRLRDPRPMAPGLGTVRLTVNGNVTIQPVKLGEGIDPARRAQIYTRIEKVENSAA